VVDPEISKILDDIAAFKTAVNTKVADLKAQIAGIAMGAEDKAALTAAASDLEAATAALPSQ
jgi:hypothetical protein